VRIPAEVARSARFTAGLPVELSVEESGLVVRAAGVPRLSLGQKLERFDPSVHGGEVTAAAAAGQERF
jgi:antitoxin MazE